MARLGKPIRLPEFDCDAPDWQTTEHAKEFDKLEATGKLLSFPCADSYAYYFVKSLNPLVLQHVDFMDGWTLPAAHLRGLRTADIEPVVTRQIERKAKQAVKPS